MRRLRVVALAVVAGALAMAGASDGAWAQGGACVDLCRIPCVKPISIADRWDDVTGIPGYMGEGAGRNRRPDWRNDEQYNFETFNDANVNGLWDAGESYVDGNGSGSYDAEAYDPWTTGYTGLGDAGLQLILHPGSTANPPVTGLYLSVGLPPINKGTPLLDGDSYRTFWSECEPYAIEPGDRLVPFTGGLVGPTNQAMRDEIAQDPNAQWDDATQTVVNSDFPLSPRIWFIPVHDPRIPFNADGGNLVVRKVAAFFAEVMVGSAEVRGRLLRVQAFGETCGGASAGGSVVMCPVPATESSWGQVKATYR